MSQTVVILVLGMVLSLSSVASAIPTGLDVVLFTGLGSGSTALDDLARNFFGGKTGQGLERLNQEFAARFSVLDPRVPPLTFMSRVFPWDEEAQAGDFIRALSPSDELVVVGHSFGADSSLELSKTVIPARSIDLLVTIDDACVNCPGGTTKPANALHEIEFYHDANNQDDGVFVTPYLQRLADADQSVNVTSLFNEQNNQSCLSDVGGVVLHTNISNSECVHQMILGAAFSLLLADALPDVTSFLAQGSNAIPEPSTWVLLLSGIAGMMLLRKSCSRTRSSSKPWI